MTSSDFTSACQYVRSHPPIQVADIYGLFKQATSGDCTAKAPRTHQLVKAAKHAAWKKNAGLSKAEAREKYVALVDSLAPTWRGLHVTFGDAAAAANEQTKGSGDGSLVVVLKRAKNLHPRDATEVACVVRYRHLTKTSTDVRIGSGGTATFHGQRFRFGDLDADQLRGGKLSLALVGRDPVREERYGTAAVA